MLTMTNEYNMLLENLHNFNFKYEIFLGIEIKWYVNEDELIILISSVV